MPAPRKYPPELRERAMRLVKEARKEDPELSVNQAVIGMALWVRDSAGQDVTGVIQHSDAEAQYTALRYSERLADVGAIASIGSVGDSYDCQSVST